MTTTELRPLGFGELLDRTFSYYRSHFWVFVGIMAVPQVLRVPFTFALDVFSETRDATGGTALLALAVMMALVPVLLLGYTAAYGATTFAVSEIHMGRTVTIRGAYGAVRGQMWRLVKLELAVLVRMLAWMITVVLSPIAILLAFWYAFAVPALLLENLGANQSLKRSRFLTRGQLDRIFLIGLLITIVTWVVSLVIEAPLAVAEGTMAGQNKSIPYWLNASSSIAGGIAGAFTTPLLMIALVLLYYDVRVRKEGFDLQVMMEGLEQGSPARESRGEARAETEAKLTKTSVALMVLLSIITVGIYIPIWFLRRRRAINLLQSSEKIGAPVFIAALLLMLLGLGFSVAAKQNTPTLDGLAHLATFAAQLLILVECFKVRRILLDHLFDRLDPQRSGVLSSTIALERDVSFSGLLTFFFGIYYLQYKINESLEAVYAPLQAIPNDQGVAATEIQAQGVESKAPEETSA